MSYPQPLGLDWHELIALARPIAAAPDLVGISIADFEPDRDPDGTHAARIVDAVATLCEGAGPGDPERS